MHAGTEYKSPAIRELRDQQVRYAPRVKKLAQATRAERLISELDPKREYSYEYLFYRLTDLRPTSAPQQVMSGEVASHDLRLFVEDVSNAADLRAEEAGEEVHTVESLSKLLQVSTRTINRWRNSGLVSRRFLIGGRKRVGFLNSSVQRFIAAHGDLVRRGGNFSQITPEEREMIVARARRLAHAGACPAEVARRLSRKMNRSIEAIRYTLKQFDSEFPQIALFPDQSGPLSEETRQKIYQQYRRGNSVDSLAARYCRTRTTIYRVVNEMRARRIEELPLDYIDNPIFANARAEAKILAPMPEPAEPSRKVRAPSGLPQYLASLYEVALLTREQEYHLFRQLNFLKYKAGKLRAALKPNKARAATMDEIERLYDEAVKVKNEIVQANLRLVVSIAKRHVGPNDEFFELVSDGNMSLIRAVEKFDFARGNKFSTYASWAIMKNFARTIPEEFKHRDRFRTASEEVFNGEEDARTDQAALESAQDKRKEAIVRLLSKLDEREQKIIIARYGLDHSVEPQTLKEVGEDMGVTKERVRQLESRALAKLRQAAAEEKIDIPDL